MSKIIENNNFEISKIKLIARGVFMALALSMIFLVLYSAVLTYTSMPESTSNLAIIIISSISILFASQLITRKIKRNGITIGGIIGGIYIALMYLISSFISGNFSLGFSAVLMLVSSIIAGMIGGIIGVNLK